MAASTPTLAMAALLCVAISSQFPAKSAADNAPECPYPCLPPPTSGASILPPSPPSQPSLPYPPPPPQPYTPSGYLPPPSGYLPAYVPPGFGYYSAPPPPNPIMPYFPFYFRASNSAAPPTGGFGFPTMVALVCFLLY